MPIPLQRIVHVNNNCTDLDKSLAFYERFGLERTIHTAPEQPQDGTAFGLPEAQWDAWILGSGFSLDLLKWVRPKPWASTRREPGDLGLSHITVQVPGVEERFVRDPDQTLVRLVDGEPGRISMLTINCSDVGRSSAFYEEVTGLVPQGDGMLTDPGGFPVELRRATGNGRPNRVANAVGYFRMAFLVSDIRAGHAALVDAGADCTSPPVDLDLGPGVPRCSAMLFSDPDGAMLELIGPELGDA